MTTDIDIVNTFRHKIGDCLYDLYTPYDCGAEETRAYPIMKRTERYVYIHEFNWDHRHLIRFSIADLERDGRAWNGANRMSAYTRPLPHWPLMPAVVSDATPQALTP